MSSATSVICAICLEEEVGRVQQAKSLPCGHAYCITCLVQLRASDAASSHLTCPTCRRRCLLPVRGVYGLNDFPITSTCQANINNNSMCERSACSIDCHVCLLKEKAQRSAANVLCDTCRICLCLDCEQRHLLVPAFARHTVTSLTVITSEGQCTHRLPSALSSPTSHGGHFIASASETCDLAQKVHSMPEKSQQPEVKKDSTKLSKKSKEQNKKPKSEEKTSASRRRPYIVIPQPCVDVIRLPVELGHQRAHTAKQQHTGGLLGIVGGFIQATAEDRTNGRGHTFY